MKLDDSTLIVAHPDDEILFFASILSSVKQIIVCFGLSPNQAEDISLFSSLNAGRIELMENFPLKNTIFLNIAESPRAYTLNPILFPSETFFGLKNGSCAREKYESNFKIIVQKLEKYIKNTKYLITHNSWGEYGHPEHVQVHRAVVSLAKKYEREVYVNGYFSQVTTNLMYKTIDRINTKPIFKYTNKNYFSKLKNYYIKMNCWTWENKYEPPAVEVFYKLNNLKLDINTYEFNKKDLKAANLPLNLINFDSHRLPVRYFSLITPRFIHIFIFKILLNLKYKIKWLKEKLSDRS